MAKPQSIVFYSWQSDLPNATNRGFIEEALKRAAKAIQNDESIGTSIIIDRDTKDVPGSPDIASTIFGKIEQSQVFVCDISIINQEAVRQLQHRPTPNPNVLIELGYALKALGDRHMILLLNEEYGDLKSLPFDLHMRRAITYTTPEQTQERAPERNRLVNILTDALRTILNNLDKPLPGESIVPSLAEEARIAVEADRPNQVSLIRKYMVELADIIAKMTPTFANNEEDQWDEQLVQAIEASTDIVIEFARLAEITAVMGASEAARILYKGFANILNLYYPIPDPQRPLYDFANDLAKFLGHELFVIFFAYLLREERWEIIADLFEENLYARIKEFLSPTSAPFHHLSTWVRLLDQRNERLNLHRLSLRFDILNNRHTQGELAKFVPMEQFAEADFFLFLRAELQETTRSRWISWVPWSVLGMRSHPQYLQEAERSKYAQKLLRPLGVEDISTLRTRLEERSGRIAELWRNGFWHYAMAGFDFSTIGTK